MQQNRVYPLVGTQVGSTMPAPSDGSTTLLPRRLGEILVDGHIVSPRALKRALRLQDKKPAGGAVGANGTRMRIGEALLKLKLVTAEDLSYALSRQYAYPCLQAEVPHVVPPSVGTRWKNAVLGITGMRGKMVQTQDQPHNGARNGSAARRNALKRAGADVVFSHELVCAYAPFSAESEAFRTLRSHLLLRWFDGERRMLAIVSPEKGEGRSYVAANLAVAFSQMGKRTLLVDADLRHPRQDLIFNLPRNYGLSGVLGMPRDVDETVRIPCLGHLSVVAAGVVPPNPLELLSQARLKEWLNRKAAEFEVILIDTPPSASYMDAAVIAAHSAGALVVARTDHTRVSEAQQVTASLAGSGVPVVGTVLNRF